MPLFAYYFHPYKDLYRAFSSDCCGRLVYYVPVDVFFENINNKLQ